MDLILAETQTVSLGVIATITAVISLFTGGPIIFYLRSISKDIDDRIKKQDTRIAAAEQSVKNLAEKHSDCKVDCQRNNVSKEDWVRSEGYTRKVMGKLAETLSRMDGKLQIAEQLPAIIGEIVSKVASQINKGGPNEQA